MKKSQVANKEEHEKIMASEYNPGELVERGVYGSKSAIKWSSEEKLESKREMRCM